VYFALAENTLVVENIRYIVSATAPGVGVRHSELKYPLIQMIRELLLVRQVGIVLGMEEVEGREPDETVILELVPQCNKKRHNVLRIRVARSGESSCATRNEPPHNSVLN
jgi:hypothetical protein